MNFLRPIKMHHLILSKFLEVVVALGLSDLVGLTDLASSHPVAQSSLPESPRPSLAPQGSVDVAEALEQTDGGPPAKVMRQGSVGAPESSTPADPAISSASSASLPNKEAPAIVHDHDYLGKTEAGAVEPVDGKTGQVEQSLSVEKAFRICPECNSKVDKRIFKRHLEAHDDSTSTLFKCDLCEEPFTHASSLMRHKSQRCPR